MNCKRLTCSLLANLSKTMLMNNDIYNTDQDI